METRGIEGLIKGIRYYIYGTILTMILFLILVVLFVEDCKDFLCNSNRITVPVYAGMIFSVLFWAIYPYMVMNKNCGKSGNALYVLMLMYIVTFVISNVIIEHVYAPKKVTIVYEDQVFTEYKGRDRYYKVSTLTNICTVVIYMIIVITYMTYYKCNRNTSLFSVF